MKKALFLVFAMLLLCSCHNYKIHKSKLNDSNSELNHLLKKVNQFGEKNKIDVSYVNKYYFELKEIERLGISGQLGSKEGEHFQFVHVML